MSNGLGILGVGSDDFGVTGTIQTSGTVVDQAVPVINTAQPIVLGNVREGATSPTAVVSVTNQATGNDQADLNAAITGNAPVTATGSFDQLGPGGTDSSSLQVGMNTATAGAIDGTATIAFVSDATSLGGGQLNLASQNVQVQGAVYRLAQGTATPDPVDFGNLRIDTTAEQALSIANTAAADGYSEVLNAAFGTATGAAGDNDGSVSLLAAGSSDTTSMVASLDTSVAGTRSGTVIVDFASDGTGTTGEAASSVGSQEIDMTGTVYRLASPDVNTAQPVVLAARVGDAAPTQNLSVTNQSPDAFTEGLKADIGDVDTGFSGSGNIDNLAAGDTDNTSLSVGLADTSSSQNISGEVDLNFQSTGAGTTGATDISVGSESVQVQGRVYQQAVAQVNTPNVDFGIVHVGDAVATEAVEVGNAASVATLNDVLKGSIGDATGAFSASGDLGAGLGAQVFDSTSLSVGLDTSAAGNFSGSASVDFQSSNPDLDDLLLDSTDVILSAQVNNYANPVFEKTGGAGSLSGGGVSFDLDFGNLLLGGSTVNALLAVVNDVVGPTDLLDGLFNLTSVGDFLPTGFDAFSDLDAGESTGALSVAFNPLTLGLFEGIVLLEARGWNASGFEQFFDVTLNLRARVSEQECPRTAHPGAAPARPVDAPCPAAPNDGELSRETRPGYCPRRVPSPGPWPYRKCRLSLCLPRLST